MYNKKSILMVISVLVFTMVVGYALLSQNLSISGTSHIDSNWNVQITGVTKRGGTAKQRIPHHIQQLQQHLMWD